MKEKSWITKENDRISHIFESNERNKLNFLILETIGASGCLYSTFRNPFDRPFLEVDSHRDVHPLPNSPRA